MIQKRWWWKTLDVMCPYCKSEFRPWHHNPREMDELIKSWQFCPVCGVRVEQPKLSYSELSDKPLRYKGRSLSLLEAEELYQKEDENVNYD